MEQNQQAQQQEVNQSKADTRCFPTSISLNDADRAKLKDLGGSKWIREQIAKAVANDAA